VIDAADIAIPDLGVEVQLSPTAETASIAPQRPPTTIVVLGYSTIGTDAADARTMLDVLQLERRYAEAEHVPRFVVQMLDDDHADLAVLTGSDDFLVSSALGSQFVAQLIEQPERRAVLLALYGADDASIRMIRCDRLGVVGTQTMAEIVAAAYAAGVLAIGWRCSADGSVVLNADADSSVTLTADDELVVVG
jgi:hypothetical protein